jgi:hypothetical protein
MTTGYGLARPEQRDRDARRLLRDVLGRALVLEVRRLDAPAGGGEALLALIALERERLDAQPAQKLAVLRPHAVRVRDHERAARVAESDVRLVDARVGARDRVGAHAQRDLRVLVERRGRGRREPERRRSVDDAERARRIAGPSVARDARGHARRVAQIVRREAVGIGVAGLLADHRPHAEPLVHRQRGRLEPALLVREAGRDARFTVDLGELGARRARDREQLGRQFARQQGGEIRRRGERSVHGGFPGCGRAAWRRGEAAL